ncbi:MAG: ParB/RepB/Spo0J family partition protein [Bacilli bacterium]|nr:ParB/RepB/Spo0J family partition protein [Bacilli bacterium]
MNLERIKLSDIDNFKNHPYKVENDESLEELKESIKTSGLLNPIIVRPKENGRYEMISGHRRKLALELLGEKEVNATVKELSDDEATILMVDSNISRERILPSEKAKAYKMKYDAMKQQGKKVSGPEVQNSEIESDRNIRRYIRLTNLIPELLELVDNSVTHDKRTFLTMGIKPAVELSYLNKDEQELVYASITYNDLTPSHGQAIQIRELSKNKKLDYDSLENILTQNKGNQNEKISFNKEKIESVLPLDLLKRDKRYIEKYIINAIVKYKELNLKEKDLIDLKGGDTNDLDL